MIFTLFTVIVPPEKMSPGRSTVACWMNPTMSNCEATAGTCAVVGIVSAAAIVTITRAHTAVALAPNDRGRRLALLLRVSIMCSSRWRAGLTPLAAIGRDAIETGGR